MILVLAAVALLWPGSASGQDGALQTIRDDVRDGPPRTSSPAGSSGTNWLQALNNADDGNGSDGGGGDGGSSLPLFVLGVVGAGVVAGTAVTAPIWVPITVLGDGEKRTAYFPSYPYEDSSGHLMFDNWANNPRPWSVRFDIDYTNSFDRIDSFGGHFLLDTSSRAGLNAAVSQLEERLPTGRDQLWLGDVNAVLRFAQSEWAEFRTGFGVNWLADSREANFGFNFNYEADIFPRKPWVISSTIDAGTLGFAALFRFRSTVGVVVRNVEVYTGYEYLDIERTHTNSLVAGLRFWF